MQQKLIFHECTCVDLFNFLQDLRHIALIDLRPIDQYHHGHIRGSLSIIETACIFFKQLFTKANFLYYIKQIDEKARLSEEKYKTKPIRRILFLSDNVESIDRDLIISLISTAKLTTYKSYILKQNFQQFQLKYPFLCLSKDIIDKYHLMIPYQDQQKANDKNSMLSEEQKSVLYSYSQFPSELIENEIFLGSVYNSNNKNQLNDLSIKTLIDLQFYEDETIIPAFKKEQFNYHNIPISDTLISYLNFNEIHEVIDNCLQDNTKYPILIYCQDGYSFASAIAITYLMWKRKLRFDIASLKVFQLRGDTKVNKTIYSQIMIYNPQVIQEKN